MKTRNLVTAIPAALALCFAIGGVVGTISSVKAAPAAVSVKGTVKLQGTVPKGGHIDMSADPKCAQLHPTGVTSEEFTTDGNGGLQNVIVYVSQGLGDAKFDPPAQPVELEQKGCQYKPHVIALRANQPINVVNSDPTSHNIHPSPTNNREMNQSQPPGTPLTLTFAREEIAIPVKCNIHPWMKSYVAVFKHPFFAVTGKDGSFEIPNLPPGSYTITAWHEKLGTSVQKVTVGDSEAKVDFVFKSAY